MAPEMRSPSRRTIDWMRPQEAQAPLKIERKSDGKTTIISLIGRIRSEDLDELKAQMDDKSERTILDLDDVTLVDAAVIRFLSSRERRRHIGSLPAVRARVDSTRTSGRRNSA
jgi:anti-anti-sigma regulatory factor